MHTHMHTCMHACIHTFCSAERPSQALFSSDRWSANMPTGENRPTATTVRGNQGTQGGVAYMPTAIAGSRPQL